MFKTIRMVFTPITKNESIILRSYFIGLVILSLLLIGCKTVRKTAEAYQACSNDPVCVAQAQQLGQLTTYATTQTLEDTPDMSGIAALIGIGVGTIGTILYKLVLGFQIERRKNVQNTKKQ